MKEKSNLHIQLESQSAVDLGRFKSNGKLGRFHDEK